jgi:hypothetical protein
MHEENLNTPEINKGAETDPAADKPAVPEENNAHDKEANNNASQENIITDFATEESEENPADRRKFPRAEFTYPVEFKNFSQNPDHASFKGYLKDISVSGACLQFEDRYGRFQVQEMNNAKIKISFNIPYGDKVSIFAQIRWIKKIDPRNFFIKMGIEFHNLEAWQIDMIEKLITMRNKDHNMMWNLWEQYENSWR